MHTLNVPEKYAGLLGGPLLLLSGHRHETQGPPRGPLRGAEPSPRLSARCLGDPWGRRGLCRPAPAALPRTHTNTLMHTHAHTCTRAHFHTNTCRGSLPRPSPDACDCALRPRCFLAGYLGTRCFLLRGCPASPCPLASPVPPSRWLHTQQWPIGGSRLTAFWKESKLKHCF